MTTGLQCPACGMKLVLTLEPTELEVINGDLTVQFSVTVDHRCPGPGVEVAA